MHALNILWTSGNGILPMVMGNQLELHTSIRCSLSITFSEGGDGSNYCEFQGCHALFIIYTSVVMFGQLNILMFMCGCNVLNYKYNHLWLIKLCKKNIETKLIETNVRLFLEIWIIKMYIILFFCYSYS